MVNIQEAMPQPSQTLVSQGVTRFLFQFHHLAIEVYKLLHYYMKYIDSSWSARQVSFYTDELLTATKNKPRIESHVRTWTSPREKEEIMGNLSFKSLKSVLGKAI